MTATVALRIAVLLRPRMLAEAMAAALGRDGREVQLASPDCPHQFDLAIVGAACTPPRARQVLLLPPRPAISEPAYLITDETTQTLAVSGLADILRLVDELGESQRL